MKPKKRGYHRHHIIPKFLGGTDDDSNIIYLTPAEHAKVHYERFLEHGHSQDAMAYLHLKHHWSGDRKISGYKQTPEHIAKRVASTDYKKISEKLKGRKSPTTGMTLPCSAETKIKISESLKGKKVSNETREKIAKTLSGRRDTLRKGAMYCIACKKRVARSRFDRCKGINHCKV